MQKLDKANKCLESSEIMECQEMITGPGYREKLRELIACVADNGWNDRCLSILEEYKNKYFP